MSDEVLVTDPLPPRVAWFAPWVWWRSWKPWKRWAFGILLVASPWLYLLSDVPVWYALHQTRVYHHLWVFKTYQLVYDPSHQFANRFPIPWLGIQQIQYETLETWFGLMVDDPPVFPEELDE